MGEENKFPIQVSVSGAESENTGEAESIFQRGAGEFPGEDVADPLLYGLVSMQSRGRAGLLLCTLWVFQCLHGPIFTAH